MSLYGYPVSSQHHCGISFLPCTASIGNLLDRAFPLMPSHIRTWMPKLSRSVIVPKSLPLLSVVRDPSNLPLLSPASSTIIQMPSPAQTVVARLLGHAVMQCSSPLWHVIKEIGKGLDSRVLTSMYSTTQGHPLLLAQDSWDVEDATVELIGIALRYESWDVAHLLAQRCIAQYPEAHAASVPARLLLLLADAHGSSQPPPRAQLVASAHRIQRVLDFHWGGHHPSTLDVTVAQAWVSCLGRDWRQCVAGLQAAVSLSAVLSVSLKNEDLTSLKQLLTVIATDDASKEFISPEQVAMMANSASLMLQWALDAYDFHFGARHTLTMTAAREFSMSLLLLIDATKNESGGVILERGIEIASKTLEWQTRVLGRCHLETLATGQLLAVLLANQGRYRRCIEIYEAVIRNAFTRVCWCLPDPYFYDMFETVRPTNRFFPKIKAVLPNLDDEQALAALNRDIGVPISGQADTSMSKPPNASGNHKSPEPTDGGAPVTAPKQPNVPSPVTSKDASKANFIQLDPTDHPIFPTMQSKAASDKMCPVIPDLVNDMFLVYINFAVEKHIVSRLVSLFLLLDYFEKQSYTAVSYDDFETACTKSEGDVTSHSFLTWLLDLSETSDVQVMEYIEHYPFRIPKEELFNQDSDVIFLLCHPKEKDSKSGTSRDCILDHYLGHLLSKAETAVFNACQLILSGDSKSLSQAAQAYSSPLEKLKRAISKLKVILLLLGKLKEKEEPEVDRPPDSSLLFKRQSVTQGLRNEAQEESVITGGTFFEELAENAEETVNRTEMRRRYRHFMAHIRTSLRLPTNLRCEELDILANLMYYYLDVKTFRTWWENRYKSGTNATSLFGARKTEYCDELTRSSFEEY
ncbi:hypothetical protein cyc_00247 [Cyclospora cayetanensis]|uniref:Uncharacterized protein n=1 Tax=Cyclospora cayetanensis TaxID=88456 RepID=A0A1D3D9N4_9EIME|nr:hypothetical protein cyc_00247 [Cyclospora cayetanensis]